MGDGRTPEELAALARAEAAADAEAAQARARVNDLAAEEAEGGR